MCPGWPHLFLASNAKQLHDNVAEPPEATALTHNKLIGNMAYVTNAKLATMHAR